MIVVHLMPQNSRISISLISPLAIFFEEYLLSRVFCRIFEPNGSNDLDGLFEDAIEHDNEMREPDGPDEIPRENVSPRLPERTE